ncbi:MBL fold metallo-hydrolase [Bacillus kwashiorkori]|uniref:MBL fold metallo-hydrolase n=1 Tax=Bacillus kwashiorkori TaxID=1522318 RepID=UPI0007817B68|nr:MBL fold metallo-hydrolase [Bacillus kwashiorkori]
MQLTVIGCWGAYPKVNEASTGYLLEYDGFRLLIDCGSAVLSKLQQFVKPTMIDACIISHYHTDHIADIGVLQHALMIDSIITGSEKQLPIYGHTLDAGEFAKLTYKQYTQGVAYSEGRESNIGPFTVSFLRTNHPVPCYAMRFEAGGKVLIFTADSAYQDSFIRFAKDADLLLSECNFYEDMDGENAGHMNSRDVGTIAKKANVKQTVLTHLPQFRDVETLVKEVKKYYNGPVQLAKLGLQIDV